MSNHSEKENPPFVSLIYLLLIALAGLVVFTILAFITGFFIYGSEVLSLTGTKQLGFLKLAQTASTLGIFIVPAVIFARIQSRNPLTYLKLNTPVKPLLVLLGITIMVASAPFMEWMISVNKQMNLPDFLQGLERWMRVQEDQLKELTMQLLKMNHPADLVINLVMIAILPAIGEELIFRGCLQKIMTRWTNNYHWGIWTAAIIFSAIHMQFYGFFPRMLLGALFGYLLVWSKSIWIPILAHFINNGTAVISAYVYQKNGQPIEKINETPYATNAYVYFFSLLLTAALMWIFYKKAIQYYEDLNKIDVEGLD